MEEEAAYQTAEEAVTTLERAAAAPDQNRDQAAVPQLLPTAPQAALAAQQPTFQVAALAVRRATQAALARAIRLVHPAVEAAVPVLKALSLQTE